MAASKASPLLLLVLLAGGAACAPEPTEQGAAMQKAAGLEYEMSGDGEPVLLIHGALIAETFRPLMREPALAPYRLIRYHRRGHAGSDPMPETFSIEQQAQDAAALLAHLGVERAHVVGHSGGGVIGTELAGANPGLVHSLVVLEPAAMPPAALPAFLETLEPALAAHESGDGARAVELFLEMVGEADWRRDLEQNLPGGLEQAVRDSATFFGVEVPAFRASASAFYLQRASRITAPVLYGIGSGSIPRREPSQHYYQSLVPQAEVVVIPGVDHSMLTQGPKQVAEAVAEFLARHPL